MRIITTKRCKHCCYCIPEEDNYGICCKDNIYKHININQMACKYICDDEEDIYYQM